MKLLAAIAPLALVACTTAQGEDTYRGVYESGFEVSNFTVCGSGETWWLETAGVDVWGDFRPAFNAEVVLVVKATVDHEPEEGFTGFGHLSAFPAQITVMEIISHDADEAAIRACREGGA
ncbi:hypothetical protein [Parvularcula lutaonensis]|uniref:Lipoprotein n=1 Tax=Parvularcula lutaonensis TaxID=491923 RepID=A0ABV7MEC9_9PROT|nr:hypothetical protein [Parvularcula lutaonensis]GGY49697.1 hypothetical protein GCM10007148_17900 [Parvularcula lutaonensis]